MQEFEIIFYDKPDGTEPAKEFILSLDKKMRAKLLLVADLLAHNGYFRSGPPHNPYQWFYQKDAKNTCCRN